jgi:hypothetical protein
MKMKGAQFTTKPPHCILSIEHQKGAILLALHCKQQKKPFPGCLWLIMSGLQHLASFLQSY